jgi:hypothetical protein
VFQEENIVVGEGVVDWNGVAVSSSLLLRHAEMSKVISIIMGSLFFIFFHTPLKTIQGFYAMRTNSQDSANAMGGLFF